MELKIIHISDIHCENENLSRIKNLDYDLIISSGDFECLETAIMFSEFKNSFAVTGNLDDVSIMKYLSNKGILLDGKIKKFNEITMAGIGGIDPRTNLESLKMVMKDIESKIDILVTHNPPHKILDKTFFGISAGLREIKEVSETLNPRIHLFGHIHESPGVKTINNTTYINPGPLRDGNFAEIILGNKITVNIKNLFNL